MKLEETSSFSQLFALALHGECCKRWSCVLSTAGEGSTDGGCLERLDGGNELPSDDDGNKNSYSLHQDPDTFSQSFLSKSQQAME